MRALPTAADDRRLVVVSVGTDHHPFDRLVLWADELATAPCAAFLAWEQREKDFQEKKNKYNKRPRDEPESGKTA